MKKHQIHQKRPDWVLERIKENQEFYEKSTGYAPSANIQPPPSGLEEYQGTLTEEHLIHILKRTLFGLRVDDLEYFEGMDLNQLMDTLFTPQASPSEPVNDYIDRDQGEVDPQVSFGESWVDTYWDGDYESGRISSLKAWWQRILLHQERSIHMKLHLFLHSILVVQNWDVFYGSLCYRYWKTLYDGVFGSYKTLVRDITTDPAMLLYLNGNYNSVQAPDENYARELQELFCIGKGPDSGYTERDVQLAAKILTGWKLNWEDRTVHFAAWDHDTSDKQFSEFYGNRIITGRSGSAGAEETDELIDMIFDNQETAKYLARRLYSFFVLAEINEDVESNIIEPLAEDIRNSNYNLASATRTLLSSQHFMDTAKRGTIIKSPADFLTGTLRLMSVSPEENQDIDTRYQQYLSIHYHMSGLGMDLGDPPSVAGWPAYYQSPQYDRSWITTDSVTSRALLTDSLLYWGMWTLTENINADILQFIDRIDGADDPNTLVQQLSRMIYGIDISSESFDLLKSILLSGQSEDFYWTNAWLEYISDPEDEMKQNVVNSRLQSLLRTMFQSAESQLS